ncbi:MAG: hypothetical protein P8Y53_06410, partial [Pseudolabrys sp.]
MALAGAVFAALLVLLSPSEGRAACAATGTNQTCTNSVTISGSPTGINDTATLTLTNTATGSIVGTGGTGGTGTGGTGGTG